MNQTNNKSKPKLYIFDFDNTLIRHKETCMQRVPTIAGQVVHAYTGQCPKEGARIACQSFAKSGDGFEPFLGKKDNYLAMHRHFNALVNFVTTADLDPSLPRLVKNLSDYAHVCVASHCTENTLKSAMDMLGYSKAFVDQHVFGLETLDGLKSNSTQNVLQKICDRYDVAMPESFLIEDSMTNIKNAEKFGIGGSVLVSNKQTASNFIQSEIKKLTQKKRGVTCLQA